MKKMRKEKTRYDFTGGEKGGNGIFDPCKSNIKFGQKIENVLLGKTEKSEGIHGAISDQNYCDLALGESIKESDTNNFLMDSVKEELINFGLQVLDRAKDKEEYFVAKGFLTQNESDMAGSKDRGIALAIGIRALSSNKQLRSTIKRIQIGFGSSKIRKRLSGILSKGKMAQDIGTLHEEMDYIRKAQPEDDSNDPQSRLGGQLLYDLEKAFGRGLLKEKELEVRYYSASATLLDYAGGIDCWVEMYDTKNKRALITFTIDVTLNEHKQYDINKKDYQRKLAEYVFLLTRENIFETYKHRSNKKSETENSYGYEIKEDMYKTEIYKDLLSRIVAKFKPILSYK